MRFSSCVTASLDHVERAQLEDVDGSPARLDLEWGELKGRLART
jgi:hypothetical protein